MVVPALALLVLALGALVLVLVSGGLTRDLTGDAVDEGRTGERSLPPVDAR